MEKVDIFDQEVGRAAIECNGNLVVVFNGKKAFWFKEQIESFVKEHPEAPLPLSVFSVNTPKAETISLFCLFPHFSHSGNHHFIVLNIILFHLLVFQRF